MTNMVTSNNKSTTLDTVNRTMKSYLESAILHYIEIPLDDLPIVEYFISNPDDDITKRLIHDVIGYDDIAIIDKQIEKAEHDIKAQIVPKDLFVDVEKGPGKKNVEVQLL